MKRYKRILILLAALVVICAAAFAVTRYEEKKENIAQTDEVILSLDSSEATKLSWTYGDNEPLAFHKNGAGTATATDADADGRVWVYDDDETFPVDADKVADLIDNFSSLAAAFVIEDVEDYSQYGLDEPECTISVTVGGTDYEIKLGAYSTMDEERYASIGDGRVYLLASDPMDSFDLELSDMIENDELPSFDVVSSIEVSGRDDYTAEYSETNSVTYSDDDKYFVTDGEDTLALDTEKVEAYLEAVSSLSLEKYAAYNAGSEELSGYGLDNPELTVTVDYSDAVTEDDDTDVASGTFVMSIARNPDAKEDSEEATDDSEDVAETSDDESDADEAPAAYLRIGDSQIVYELSADDYDTLMAASLDDLRHSELMWADFGDVTEIDITLEGEAYTLTSKTETVSADEVDTEESDGTVATENEDGTVDVTTWYLGDAEIDISDLKSAVLALSAAEFTDETAADKEEISVKLRLDNKNVSETVLTFYRYDGESCLAVVDGKPLAFVSRAKVVNLIEAVNALVL